MGRIHDERKPPEASMRNSQLQKKGESLFERGAPWEGPHPPFWDVWAGLLTTKGLARQYARLLIH